MSFKNLMSSKRIGLLLAGRGVMKFVAPQVFEPITKRVFPDDTRQWIYRNGATEIALGLALANDRTRKAGIGGVAAYLLWIGTRFLSARTAANSPTKDLTAALPTERT